MKYMKFMVSLFVFGMMVYPGVAGLAQQETSIVIFSSPEWSPDGTKIAFSGNFNGEERTDIAVLDLDSMEVRNLTDDNDFADLYPQWSPDGKEIAYTSQRQNYLGAYDVMVVDVETGVSRNITENSIEYDSVPVWSPDGSQIAYLTIQDVALPEHDIWVVGRDGSHPSNISDAGGGQHIRQMQWLPDSEHLVFSSESYVSGENSTFALEYDGLYLADLETGGVEWLIQPDQLSPDYFRLSPDGDEMLVTLDNEVRLVPLAAPEEARLIVRIETQAENPLLSAEGSPDGGKILILAPGGDGRDIWTANVDGSELVNLSADVEAFDSYASYSPDGTQILFSSDRSGNNDIWLMDADGSNLVNLTEGLR
jgi:Tol biopolymer transport system component